MLSGAFMFRIASLPSLVLDAWNHRPTRDEMVDIYVILPISTQRKILALVVTNSVVLSLTMSSANAASGFGMESGWGQLFLCCITFWIAEVLYGLGYLVYREYGRRNDR